MYQSSRGYEPVWAPVAALIPGWREGVQLMAIGESRRFWIPEPLAYAGATGKPAGTMVFDVELIDAINPKIAPDDVATPPADAEISPSGLASKVLRKGTGTTKPRGSQEVTVHYTGWSTEGVMFDSSYLRGAPATFALTGVIRGWTEGLKLMVPGEKRRFWIPEKLAYKGERGKPQGMLVFDVELLRIR
jgi:peptidylprolyl isomerase